MRARGGGSKIREGGLATASRVEEGAGGGAMVLIKELASSEN